MKPLILIILLTSAISAEACWDSHPLFWDKTETVRSVTETVGVGCVLPTVLYQTSLKLWPTKIQDYRLIRVAGIHLAVGLVACWTMQYQSHHDTDPAYTNVILLLPVSCLGNALVDVFRNGLKNDLPGAKK